MFLRFVLALIYIADKLFSVAIARCFLTDLTFCLFICSLSVCVLLSLSAFSVNFFSSLFALFLSAIHINRSKHIQLKQSSGCLACIAATTMVIPGNQHLSI